MGKWSIPVVCIDGISTPLCAGGFDGQVFLVIVTPWGKLLQFSWGKLLLWMPGIMIGLKCNQITLFIRFYSEIHHIYAFLHDKQVKSVAFITAD